MYKVKFWNPATGEGFIEGYKTAAKAKAVVEKYNELYNREGTGIVAKYLGKDK